jgi:hypothetical protein
VSGVTVIDDEAVVGDVPPGGTKLSDEPFLISLDTTLADGSLTTFDLVVIDADEAEYENEWSLTALAPEIEPVELTWSDTLYGNGNGILENGERATFTVTLKNFGAGLADRVTGFLRSVDPQVTLYDTLVVYDDIGLVEESTGGATFSLSDTDINSPFRCWIMFVDNHDRRIRHDFHLLPPPTPEGLMSDTSYGPDTITLQWLPIQLGGLRGYHVYRSEDEGGPFSRVNVDIIDRTSYYWDGGLQPLTRYYYRVTAVDSSLVEGLPSTVISQSTAPPELDNFPLPFGLETSSHCAVGDVNGDGRLEIVLGADEVYVWTDNGGELFDGDNNAQTHGPITNLAAQFQPAGITLAQLDHLPGLEIIASERDSQQIHIFRHDGSELAGWPQDLRHNENTGWNWASPAVGDVDGDGEPEIVVNSQDGRTWVWHVDGSELADGDNDPLTNGVFIVREGWNLEYGHSSPALFDLDGDNAREIIFGTKYGEILDNYLLAYRHDGSQAEGFPYNCGPGSIICSPTVADLNGDGTWEIIFQSQGNLLYVVQQDGSDYPGFPIAFAANTNFNPSPAVGDFDQDGQLEIAIVSTVSTQLTHLFLIDTDDVGGTAGQPLPGWPQPLPGNSEASPVVGDIDGDGLLDVIYGIGGGDEDSPNNLYAFKASGDLVNGFPITLGGPLRPSPVICDLERDGDVDIVYGGWDNLIHVWDMPFAYDTTLIPWPTFRGHVFRDGVHRTLDLVDVPEPVVGVDLIVTQPFPNPFNPATSVRLYVPGPAGSTQQLEVRIYDLQGRKVRSLYDGTAATGWRTLVWDGRDENGRGQASGIYFLRTRSAGRTVIHKMALIK